MAAAKESSAPSAASLSASITNDAETALVSLGYKPQQAAHAIAQVLKANPEIEDSEQLIRQSLKSMA